VHRSILAVITAAGLLSAPTRPANATPRADVPREQVVLERVDPSGATTYEVTSLSPSELADAATGSSTGTQGSAGPAR